MNHRKILSLIDELLDKSSELKTSELLPKALALSKIIGDVEFEKWLLLETSGYFNTNAALTDDVFVPDYRKVPGQYYDDNKRPLLIDDPSIANTINNYAIREGVAELEGLTQQNKLLSFRNPSVNQFIKETFGVEVTTFVYSANSINAVLGEIRNKLINWIVDKHKQYSEAPGTAISALVPIDLARLHPIVQQTAGQLYKDGHFRQAILDTYIALVEAVKVKSGRYDLDNTPLMQNVFSLKNPIIKVSADSDEQMGFMWLFTGAVMGIRNPKAHRLIQQSDPQRALEWLSFASVLLRVLDDSAVSNKQDQSETTN